MEDINKYTDDNPIKLVVGNKSDLSNERQVNQIDINNFKQQTGIDVIEASAKSSDKIYEVMETITRMLINKKNRSGVMDNINNYDTPNKQGRILLSEEDNKNKEQNQDCCNISAYI